MSLFILVFGLSWFRGCVGGVWEGFVHEEEHEFLRYVNQANAS